jgi:hypothetical protein
MRPNAAIARRRDFAEVDFSDFQTRPRGGAPRAPGGHVGMARSGQDGFKGLKERYEDRVGDDWIPGVGKSR